MLPLQKIIVPVDFSDNCRRAMHYVRILAERYQSELLLLHVVEDPVKNYLGLDLEELSFPDGLRQLVEDETKNLAALAAQELSNFRVRQTVVTGDPASRIAAWAEQERASLIVMSTHGYGRFRRFLLGSVTAKVLDSVTCPVLTGAHLEHAVQAASTPFRRILCAVDLGTRSYDILAWAVDFAAESQAKLAIIHVLPILNWGVHPHSAEGLRRELRHAAHKQIEELQRKLGKEACVFIEEGPIAAWVAARAATFGTDLAIVGRSGSGAGGGRLRSTAYCIIRESPCPVISI